MRRIWFVFFSVFYIGHLSAQPLFSDTSYTLEQIVITASRMDQVSTEVNQSINTISRINLAEVPSRNLVDALMHHGVWMQKTNLGGGSPFVRGLTGNQVLILQDGIRLNNSIYRYGPNQYLTLQSIEDQSSLEILKGAGSVLYGSDAIGGVINLLSQRPELGLPNRYNVKLFTQGATDQMEKTIRTDMTYSRQNYALTLTGSRSNFGDIKGGSKTGFQRPSGYDEFHTGAKFYWIQGASTWKASYTMARQWDVPVYHKIVLEKNEINQSDRLEHQMAYIKHKYAFKHAVFNTIETSISWQRLHESRSIQKKIMDPIRSEDDKINVMGVTTQAVLRALPWLHSIVGADIYLDVVGSQAMVGATDQVLRGLYPDGTSYLNAGIFNSWHADVNTWNFTLGCRWNYYRLQADDEELGSIQLSPSAFVWNASIGKTMGQHHMYFNVDQTYRAPNIDDAGTLGIVDFRYEVPNYDLKPEKGFHFSIGHRWANKKFRVESGLFYLTLQDLITRIKIPDKIINGFPVYIKQNTDRSKIYGGEASFKWSMSRYLELHTGMQYTFGQNITADEPLRRIPPLFYHTRATIKPLQRLHTYVESINAGQQSRLAAGDLADNRISKTGTPAWNILNLGVMYTQKNWTTRMSLENILNKDYRIHGSGINEAGRLMRLSLMYNFGFN